MTKQRHSELSLAQFGLIWGGAWLLFMSFRIWALRTYAQPVNGLGAWALLLASLAWLPLALEPPRLAQQGSGRLGRAASGLALVFLGQAFLWLRVQDKAAYLLPGLALLAAGWALMQATGRRAAAPAAAKAWRPWIEAGLLGLILLIAALARLWQLGKSPVNIWYDELNLARAVNDSVLGPGKAPLYVTDQVENPGAFLWVAAAFFKAWQPGVETLRFISALFGWLALLPFYGLARRWLGPKFGLLALALFAVSRWTLVPQRVGFMSSFALFWTLSAFYFAFLSLARPSFWAGLALGLACGACLHSYTPTRLVLPLLAIYFLINMGQLKRWPGRAWLGALGGFALAGGPMLYWIAHHWATFHERAQQVSIMPDVRSQGWKVLRYTLSRHLLMFNYLGDFNSRHNLHLWPHLDFASAALFAPAFLAMHAALRKSRHALFMVLWFWIMLSAGVFSIAVEAPQAHRTILLAPLPALAVAWFLREYAGRAAAFFADGRWPRPLALSLALLGVTVMAFNIKELHVDWARHPDTWKSFSPDSNLAAARIRQQGNGWIVLISPIRKEYPYYGYERTFFARVLNRDRQVDIRALDPVNRVPLGAMGAPQGVLAIWSDSDDDITAAAQRDYPDLKIEAQRDPYESRNNYLALTVPWDRIPKAKSQVARHFLEQP